MIEKIDPRRARTWVSESLAEGSRLAELTQSRIARMRRASVIGAAPSGPSALNNTGRGVSTADLDRDIGLFFEANRARGFRTLVVEDDVARKGDPHLPETIGFVGDRVLHWTGIGPGAGTAIRLLRTGSTGYPLNAFISRRPLAEMEAFRGRQLDSVLESLSAGVVGVMVSVFDGESLVTLS